MKTNTDTLLRNALSALIKADIPFEEFPEKLRIWVGGKVCQRYEFEFLDGFETVECQIIEASTGTERAQLYKELSSLKLAFFEKKAYCCDVKTPHLDKFLGGCAGDIIAHQSVDEGDVDAFIMRLAGL